MSDLPHLDAISSPADLQQLDDAQLAVLGEEIRHRLKETVSRTGGHLSSNLGVVELTMALHRVFDFRHHRLLWDVGHQAYVHKLLSGRALLFHTNRQAGGLSGFPDPLESPFDLVKVGHSSTALSTALGFCEGHRAQGERRKVVAVVGDGALTGGMAFEALNNVAEHGRDLIVVLNDNGSFIDPPVGSLHAHLNGIRSGSLYQRLRKRVATVVKKMPWGADIGHGVESVLHRLFVPGMMFEEFGLTYFGPIDGHNRTEIEAVLHSLRDIETPILLHVVTKKGGGWQPSAEDPRTYHGPKHFDIETGIFTKQGKARIYADVLAETLLELAGEDERLVAVTAAMPSGTGLRVFGKVHPERMYDVGICEQHSFGFVQGLRLAGRRPILAHYSTFAQRGYDQLFQELVVQRNLGLVVALDRAGLVGEDGETHHGLYDIAWSRCLPGTVLLAPKDGEELRDMLRWAHAQGDTDQRAAAYLIRYPKEKVPTQRWGLKESQAIEQGVAQTLMTAEEPEPLLIWAYGAGVRLAWEAIWQLEAPLRRRISLVNARFAKPLDTRLLLAQAATHTRLLTVEEHSIIGGFGAAVLECLAAHDQALPLTIAGVRDELVAHATRTEQLHAQDLSPDRLCARMARLLGAYPRPGLLRMPDRA